MMRFATISWLLISLSALTLQTTVPCWAQGVPDFDDLANTSGRSADSPAAPATDGTGRPLPPRPTDLPPALPPPSVQEPSTSQSFEPFPPATPGPDFDPELASKTAKRQGDGVSEVVAGISSGLGAWAGAWGACLASAATGVASAGAHLPLAATLGGSGLLGAAAGAAAQYALTGKVDWGSVAASTAGSMIGMAVAGPAGAIAGGMLASLAYGEGKKLLADHDRKQ